MYTIVCAHVYVRTFAESVFVYGVCVPEVNIIYFIRAPVRIHTSKYAEQVHYTRI